jgi:hypothetical protein
MTFEEKIKDEWFNNSKSTADDLIKTAIDEGYRRDEAEKALEGSKWAKRNSDAYKRAWKQYDKLTDSDNTKLEEKRRGRLYGHKPEDQPLLPGLEEGVEIERVESKKAPTAEQVKSAQEKAIEGIAKRHEAATPDKFKKIISDAKKAQTPETRPAERKMKIETSTEEDAQNDDYKNSFGWMLSDEGYNAKGSDGKDLVTAVKLVAKAKEEGLSREELEERLKGTPWENSGNVMKEIEKAYPEETATPTAEEERAQAEPEENTQDSRPLDETEMDAIIRKNNVDVSDGVSYQEAGKIANEYEHSSKNVNAEMFLNYLRKLGISETDIKKIVDATKTSSWLRKEYYGGKKNLENIGGVSGQELRATNEGLDAVENKVGDVYDQQTKDADRATEDVAKTNPFERERDPRGILTALINGEFGDISKDADPKERNRAISTALYLGGDVVATALKNVGATFKGGTGDAESMWGKRQKDKYEAATANANKALDAATDTGIKGKQQAQDFAQNVRKMVSDERIKKASEIFGEDIKADDIIRDQARYQQIADNFKSKTLEDKANIILGMEMDGKELSPQALVAILASLSENEYTQLGAKVADLAKGVGGGIGEALKGLFSGGPFGSAPDIVSDIARGDTRAIVDDTQAANQNYWDKLTNATARRAKNQAEADRKAADINSVIKTKFPELNFVGVNNGMVLLQANEAAQKLAKELGFLTNGNYDASASIKLTNYVYDQFR